MATEAIKILAIDTNPDNLVALQAVIRDAFADAMVLTASGGTAGIELALKERPNVILLNMGMQGMDGYEVARLMKADENLKHIPLIFLTALKIDKKIRITALESGAEALLVRPFDETELITLVRAMVKIHALTIREKQENEGLSRLVEERTTDIENELQQGRKAEKEAQAANAKLKQNQIALLHLMEEMKDEISARQKAEENQKQHLKELEILAEFSKALGQLMTPQQIGQKIVDLFVHELNWQHIAIRYYLPESDSLSLLAFNQPGIINESERKMVMDRFNAMISKPGEGLSGWVWQTRQAMRVADVKQDKHYLDMFPGIKSGLYVPIMAGERAIGVISLESEELDAFSQADERMVTTLTAQAGIALDNARLFEQTVKRLKNIESLRQIDRAISSNFDMKSTLAIISETAQNQLDVGAVDILLYNQHSQILNYIYGHGFRNSGVRETNLDLMGSLAGQVVKARKKIEFAEIKGGNAASLPANLASEEFISYIGVPLIAKSKVNGVLEVFERVNNKHDRDWYDYLEAFAHQASIAIDNSGLFENLQRLNIEMASEYDTTIGAWAQTLEIRDPSYTGHSRRVMEISVKIATALGIRGEKLLHLRHGIMMHDIGMLGIPEGILLKPGKLTASEWDLVRQHPRIAYDLLSQISNWHKSLDIPYSHHEKWDGSGYPQGLRNDVIPLGARICAVADVYDTLQMERPFRTAWKKAQAADYIRTGAGSHFDPEVVRIFFALIKD
ncbi:MAG: HD domain-containing phosphohydrolase [Chloroflexota bacterium]